MPADTHLLIKLAQFDYRYVPSFLEFAHSLWAERRNAVNAGDVESEQGVVEVIKAALTAYGLGHDVGVASEERGRMFEDPFLHHCWLWGYNMGVTMWHLGGGSVVKPRSSLDWRQVGF